jgi:NADPH2:quinone reductase
MKAILMTTTGGPEVLQLNEIEKPIPNNQEISVRLKGAGINPVDCKMRKKGTRYPEKMPTILGCDGAGIVEEVGAEAKKFKVGQEVYFCHGGIGDHPGNYAEYAVINENFAASKPKSLSFVEAAAGPLVMITAWESLFDRIQLKAGQSILVHAGAGGVGHIAIQLAKYAGCTVLTTVSSQEKAEFVKSIGADHLIFYKDQDFVVATLEYTQGNGVDVVIDTVGGDTFAKSLNAVKIYGDLVTILSPPDAINWGPARVRNIRVSFELMLTPMTENLLEAKIHHGDILKKCAELYDSGKLKIKIDKIFPLADASIAHEYVETQNTIGKVVLEI